MRKYVTMQDVAEAAGVSIATLDRILNGRSHVKRATIEHVMTVAERLGYHGIHSIRRRLTEEAANITFGFLLMNRKRGLYDELTRRLQARVAASAVVRGRARFLYLDTIGPEETARAIIELGLSCDVIALHAADLPEVNAAVEAVVTSGVPVFTLLSDISSPARRGHAGAEPLKIGRSLGWMLDRSVEPGSKIGLLTGSQRFMAHRGYLEGLNLYLEEHNTGISLIDGGETLECDTTAADRTQALVAAHPDLAAIVVAGGGLSGAVSALDGVGEALRPMLLGTELSGEVDRALSLGRVDVVLSHPEAAVVESLVSQMEQSLGTPTHQRGKHRYLSVEIRISETVQSL
jgi:LacI family transcriptional regulator